MHPTKVTNYTSLTTKVAIVQGFSNFMGLTGYGRMILKCHSKRGNPPLGFGFGQEQRPENAWGATVAC